MRVHLADVVGDLLMRDMPPAIVALGHIRIAGSTIERAPVQELLQALPLLGWERL
jgi:hypothetical protein